MSALSHYTVSAAFRSSSMVLLGGEPFMVHRLDIHFDGIQAKSKLPAVRGQFTVTDTRNDGEDGFTGSPLKMVQPGCTLVCKPNHYVKSFIGSIVSVLPPLGTQNKQ